MNTKIIMYDSDKAATYRTSIKGWVSSDGRFYGDDKDSEHIARYAGSTHKKCENDDCNNITEKHWTVCEECRSKLEKERYLKLEEVPLEFPVCIYKSDIYFFNEEELDYYCEDNGIEVEDLDLVLCKPVPKPNVFNLIQSALCDYLDNTDLEVDFSKNYLELEALLGEKLKEELPDLWKEGSKRTTYRGKK